MFKQICVYNIFLLSLFLITAIAFPLLGFCMAIIVITIALKARFPRYILMALLVFTVFGVMNASKAISGDWNWYTNHFWWLQYLSYFDYIGSRWQGMAVKSTEPIYYFLSYAFSRLISGDSRVLAWMVTFLIYVPMSICVSYFIDETKVDKYTRPLMFLIIILMGVSFTLSTQLVRQEIGATMLFCSVLFFYLEKPKTAFLFVFLGIFTHNSMLIPGAYLLGVALMAKYDALKSWRYIFPAAAVSLILGAIYVRPGLFIALDRMGKSDGDISVIVMVYDFLLVSMFLWRRKMCAINIEFTNAVLVFLILYGAFLLGVATEPLPFLRMYFNIEWVRILLLVVVLGSFVNHRYFWLVVTLFLVAAIIYVELRILKSPFYYYGTLLSYLFRPITTWISW